MGFIFSYYIIIQVLIYLWINFINFWFLMNFLLTSQTLYFINRNVFFELIRVKRKIFITYFLKWFHFRLLEEKSCYVPVTNRKIINKNQHLRDPFCFNSLTYIFVESIHELVVFVKKKWVNQCGNPENMKNKQLFLQQAWSFRNRRPDLCSIPNNELQAACLYWLWEWEYCKMSHSKYHR